MNPPYIISASRYLDRFRVFLLFLMFIGISTVEVSARTSYADHCTSMVPEAAPTTATDSLYPSLQPQTRLIIGGQRLLGGNSSLPGSYGSQQSLFQTVRTFETNVSNVFKIESRLFFYPQQVFYTPSNSTLFQSSYGSSRQYETNFILSGFWSVSSQKLCMVGFGQTKWTPEGNYLNLEVVLKLKFSSNLTVHTSLVSGYLESLASSSNDPSYFEPISILSFPQVLPHQYKYSLVSDEGSSGGNIPPNSSLSLCLLFSEPLRTYKLKYGWECTSAARNCTPFGAFSGDLPPSMLLYTIQCSESEKKLRYLVWFPRSGNTWHWSDPSKALIGEGIWDGKKNELCLVVCRILKQDDPLGKAHPGDCSIRLTLRFRSVWSIKSTSHIVEGVIWTNKTAGDAGYFGKITFQSTEDDHEVIVPGSKYEYTEIKRVTKSCPVKKPREGKEEGYPDGTTSSMRFDFSAKHSKQQLGWGYADPTSVGGRLYDRHEAAKKVVHDVGYVAAAMNISYKIRFALKTKVEFSGGISSLNASSDLNGEVEISAEGVYDGRTGYLCMVGCRRLVSDDSFDCEILVKIQFSPESGSGEPLVNGSIESTRRKDDFLYFDLLDIYSISSFRWIAWRMDLENIMVLITNTLACVFVGVQLRHSRKQLHGLPSVSLIMLLMLTLGHMNPLVPFEALVMEPQVEGIVFADTGGWLDVNWVPQMVLTMVTFVLEFRLFQLAWVAKSGNGDKRGIWIAELKTLFVSLPLYIVGGSIALLTTRLSFGVVNRHHTSWGTLCSYAVLVLDGFFLFPQILHNAFQSSKGSALSPSFYVGTTFVRALPHAYDLYIGNNYKDLQIDRFYVYTTPGNGFHSPCWDVIIPCVSVVFAAMIGLQQKFGGRCFLPRRFREPEDFEKVAVASCL